MDSTVAPVPGYFATMGAEYRWLRKRAERDGPSPADYERHDTVTSLTMGVASLLAPIVAARCSARSRRARAGPARPSSRRPWGQWWSRRSPIGWPGPDGTENGPEPERRRTEPEPAATPGPRREEGGRGRRVVSVVAGGVAITTTWASLTTPGAPVEPADRARPRHGAPRARRRHARLGLHLLLEPPIHAREPVHVGDPRRAPLERALQPLDGAASAGGRRARAPSCPTACWRCSACRPTLIAPGPRPQPPLPVLDPHRRDPSAGTARGGAQHPVAPPGPPRQQPRSTSTATTAASSSRGTASSGPSNARTSRSSTGSRRTSTPSTRPHRHPRARRHAPRRQPIDDLARAALVRAPRPGLGVPAPRGTRRGDHCYDLAAVT